MNTNELKNLNPNSKVKYTYTKEWGSDGCWDSTEHGTCTVKEWLDGIHHKHPGNRSYDFRIESVEALA